MGTWRNRLWRRIKWRLGLSKCPPGRPAHIEFRGLPIEPVSALWTDEIGEPMSTSFADGCIGRPGLKVGDVVPMRLENMPQLGITDAVSGFATALSVEPDNISFSWKYKEECDG